MLALLFPYPGGAVLYPAAPPHGSLPEVRQIVVIRFGDLVEERRRGLRPVDQTLDATDQHVVVARGRPVRVEREAVRTGHLGEVVDEFLVRPRDGTGVRRDRDTTVVAEQVLDLRLHRDVDKVVRERFGLALLRHHPEVAAG